LSAAPAATGDLPASANARHVQGKAGQPGQHQHGTWTIYLLHLKQPYKHAKHFLGNPESSGFLKAPHRFSAGEFAELTPWARSGPAGCLPRPGRASRRRQRIITALASTGERAVIGCGTVFAREGKAA
jgi:hypothetical protein